MTHRFNANGELI